MKQQLLKNKQLITVFALSLLFLIPGIFLLITSIIQDNNSNTTISRVTGLKTETVVIEYTINDIIYTNEVSNQNDLTINDEIEIIYDINDPNILYYGTNLNISIALLSVSIPLLYFFISSFISIKKKYDLMIYLKTNGLYIESPIDEIYLNNKVKHHNKYPYKIRCLYTNPKSKDKFFFETDNIYDNVKDIIYKKKITKLPIYVNEDNYKEYYIDLDYIYKEK